MKYSTYNDNRYNATVHKDNNKLDVKVGNPENKKRIPGAVIEYGVKSVNGKYGDVVLDYHDVGALPDTEIIPRYIVDDVEYVITKYTKDIISGIEGISLWFDDGTSSGDSVFIPSIEGLESNNAQLFQLILSNFVSYTEHQSLTPTQQEIARVNIGVDISDVTNYERLTHKPSINGVELIGNKTSEELGLLNIQVVEELPTQDISSTIIYLVPLDDPEQDNHYKEYIYVNNEWELIGTTEVDLSNYYTKQEVNELVSDFVTEDEATNIAETVISEYMESDITAFYLVANNNSARLYKDDEYTEDVSYAELEELFNSKEPFCIIEKISNTDYRSYIVTDFNSTDHTISLESVVFESVDLDGNGTSDVQTPVIYSSVLRDTYPDSLVGSFYKNWVVNYLASDSFSGLMSAENYTKLFNIQAGAEVNPKFYVVEQGVSEEETIFAYYKGVDAQTGVEYYGVLHSESDNLDPVITYWPTSNGIITILGDYVPNIRTINGKPLTNDIVLDASDVGALPDDTVYVSSVNGQTGAVTIPTATQSVSGLMSSSDKIKLDGIERGAEVNQNAFSNVVVDNTTISADSKTDTLTLIAGDNITLTPNENVDSVTISAVAPAYTGTSPIDVSGSVISHSDSGVNAGSYGDASDQTPTWGGTFKSLSGTVNSKGHLTAVSEHTVTIPNSVATTQSNGLMSYLDKTKLDGIESGAQVNILEGVTVNGTAATITNKIAALTVPTKTSDLINDSNFATITFVDWIGG